MNANEVISSLGSTIFTKKDALEKGRTGTQSNNSKINPSITSKIEKLHEDLAIENAIMDKIVVKTEKVKVLTVKTKVLTNIIETRDSLITITVKKHLAEKRRPLFAMLKRIEGVSDSRSLLKQGGETVKQVRKNTQNQL